MSLPEDHLGIDLAEIAARLDRLMPPPANWSWDESAEGRSFQSGGAITIAPAQIETLIQLAGLAPHRKAVYAYVMAHEKGHQRLHPSAVGVYYGLEPSGFEIEADVVAGWACAALGLPRLNAKGIKPLADLIGDATDKKSGTYPHPGTRAIAYERGANFGVLADSWTDELEKEIRNVARRIKSGG